MDDESVHELEGQLGEVLVGAVDGVAGLEAGDPLPAQLGNGGPQLAGRQPVLGEGKVLGKGKDLDGTGHQVRGPRKEVGDTGMRRILGRVHLARLFQGLALVDLGHVDDAPQPALPVEDGHRLA